jgi:hypothetical protein
MGGEIKPTSNARSDISKKFGSTNSGKFCLLKNVKLAGGEHYVKAMKVGFVPPLYA